MTLDALSEAITRILPELPHLLGDDWPEVEARLTAYLELLAGDPSRRETIHDYILLLFSQHPRAHTRLVEALHGEGGQQPLDPEMRHSAIFAALQRLRARPFYVSVTCPSELWVGIARFALVVRLSETLLPDATAFPLEGHEGMRVKIAVTGVAFQPLGPNSGTLTLPTKDEAPTLTFFLHPQRDQLGEQPLQLTLTSEGEPLATITHPITLRAER